MSRENERREYYNSPSLQEDILLLEELNFARQQQGIPLVTRAEADAFVERQIDARLRQRQRNITYAASAIARQQRNDNRRIRLLATLERANNPLLVAYERAEEEFQRHIADIGFDAQERSSRRNDIVRR